MKKRVNVKRLLTLIPLAGLAVCALPPLPSAAMVFGQYTTASVSPDGEGAAFMSAGSDEFRTGVNARFRINERSDLGFELGFDRMSGNNALGLAADFKFYLLDPESTLSVDLAADASLGHFRDDEIGRTVFGLSVIASGTLVADTRIPVEPYASLGFFTILLDGDLCGGIPGCEADKSDTETVLRGGFKFWLSDEYQVMAEVKIDGNTTVGAAFNVVF
ncbi:MAG TPA: hypothetical protein VLA34_05235 [Candidatus Krumholzibacterium sp.]|nr:hypothetical protein [Candidatus Krumholzibacterium sp.]